MSCPARRASADVAIHALAQLPRDTMLELAASEPERAALSLLARAYGIEHRVRLASRMPGGDVQGTYAWNGAAAAVRFGAPSGPLAVVTSGATHGSTQVCTMAELLASVRPPEDSDTPPFAPGADETLADQRVVVVTNRPTHYRVPLFNRLSRGLTASGGSLHILFTSDLRSKPWMRPEPLEFDWTALDSRISALGLPAVPLDLERRLRQLRPTMVVAGSLSPTVGGRAALFAHRRGIPFGLWSGEIDTRQTAQGTLRRNQRRWLLRRTTFAVAYGYRSGEYLRQVMPDLPVVYGRNTTPVSPRRAEGSGSPVVEVLTVGRALPLKRLDVLVAAFKHLTDVECRLTIIGDGPTLPALREQAGSLPNVRFLGAVPSDRVAHEYAKADVFVFPSNDDVFGLVLVEAMGAGLATIVSSRPGAVADLIAPGRNGVIVDGYAPETWAAAIRAVVDDPVRRTALGDAARRTILSRWTLDHSASSLLAGVRLGVLASGA